MLAVVKFTKIRYNVFMLIDVVNAWTSYTNNYSNY